MPGLRLPVLILALALPGWSLAGGRSGEVPPAERGTKAGSKRATAPPRNVTEPSSRSKPGAASERKVPDARSSVRSASPRSVRLGPGSKARASVQILGSGLDRLPEVEVQRRGRRVDGIAARLTLAGSGTAVVDLELTREVAPARDYQLVLRGKQGLRVIPVRIEVVAARPTGSAAARSRTPARGERGKIPPPTKPTEVQRGRPSQPGSQPRTLRSGFVVVVLDDDTDQPIPGAKVCLGTQSWPTHYGIITAGGVAQELVVAGGGCQLESLDFTVPGPISVAQPEPEAPPEPEVARATDGPFFAETVLPFARAHGFTFDALEDGCVFEETGWRRLPGMLLGGCSACTFRSFLGRHLNVGWTITDIEFNAASVNITDHEITEFSGINPRFDLWVQQCNLPDPVHAIGGSSAFYRLTLEGPAGGEWAGAFE